MLRLQLPDNHRLHIWDSRYRVRNVSMIHDHLQWGLESEVVFGRITNIKYIARRDVGHPHMYSVIRPGVGCVVKEGPFPTCLSHKSTDTYREGESYYQRPDEIHQSDPLDGTITMIHKDPTNNESARVFWPAGSDWVSAEPRPATQLEVARIIESAMQKWVL